MEQTLGPLMHFQKLTEGLITNIRHPDKRFIGGGNSAIRRPGRASRCCRIWCRHSLQ